MGNSNTNTEKEIILKQALLIYGGMEIHQPKDTIELFLPFLKGNDFKLEMHDNIDIYAEERLREFDIIIQNYGEGKISKEQEQGLLTAVREGAGFAGWHAGVTDAFRDNIEYQHMSGGQFVFHPPIKDYDVNIAGEYDDITKGISDFMICSEQYYMHVDPAVKVLATTTFEHGVRMPVVSKKEYFLGKVFYCSIGHNVEDFKRP